MSHQGFKAETNDYSLKLAGTKIMDKIPPFWRNLPDHASYNVAGPLHMALVIEDIEPRAEQMVGIEGQDRFFVAVKVAGNIVLPRIGTINWVKIVDESPNPNAHVGFKSLAYAVDDLDTLSKRLTLDSGLAHKNKSGRISIKFNDKGQTVDFVEQTLEDLVQEAEQDGFGIPIRFKAVPEPEKAPSQD